MFNNSEMMRSVCQIAPGEAGDLENRGAGRYDADSDSTGIGPRNADTAPRIPIQNIYNF